MGMAVDRFWDGARAVSEEDCSMNDLERRIELEALITEREAMLAENLLCQSGGAPVTYMEDEFILVAARMRALLAAAHPDAVPTETRHCTCSHTQELQTEVERLRKDADDWASAAGAAEMCLDSCRKERDDLAVAKASLRESLNNAESWLKRVHSERDALAVENTGLRISRDQALSEMKRLQHECDGLRSQWVQMKKQRDEAQAKEATGT